MKNQIKLQTIGADIEIFLKNRKTGEVVSSEGITRGSKYDPYPFDENDPYFTTSLDNVLTEFTIRPAENSKQWIAYLNKSMAYIRSFIPKELDVHIVPSANLDEKYLQTEQALVFGCEPDFNAYTMAINEKPHSEDITLRSAGGHIHVGYEGIETVFDGRRPHKYKVDKQRAEIIRILDLYIGVPMVIIEPDNQRKELYGKAGAFRPKTYGLEYRTPSNIYLINNKLKKWVFDSVTNAFTYINENGFLEDGLSKFVQQTIDNNDKDQAKDLMKEFNLTLA